jgi:hypothetical protein
MVSADADIVRSVNEQVRAVVHREPDRTVENTIIDMLRSHGEREGAALSSYARLVEDSDDDGLKYAVRLIMEDEARHHHQIAEMLNTMHSFVWEVDVQPSIPAIRVHDDDALREETERLLAFERQDERELRRLRRELRKEHGSPLLPLIVNLMIRDTEKHIDILRFVRARARRR